MSSTLTSVGAELEGGTELSVSRGSASAHVKHVGGQRGQIFNISITRRRLYDTITPLILILRFINRETENGRQEEGKRSIAGHFRAILTPIKLHFLFIQTASVHSAIQYLKGTVHLKLKFCHHQGFKI